MNQRTDKAGPSGSGQAPLPPMVPRTAAPSPTRPGTSAELQKRSDSMPSFTKRKRMEKSADEQRWKRTDLHLIHYMSKLKEEYMQRQTSSGQPTKKSTEVATHEKQDRAVSTHNSSQQQTDRENPRVAEISSKPKDLPKSMIPIRSPPRVKSTGPAKGSENDEASSSRKDLREPPRIPKNANIRRTVSSGGSQNKEDVKEEPKEEVEVRPQPSGSKDESSLPQYKAQARFQDSIENDHIATDLHELNLDPVAGQNAIEATSLEAARAPSMMHLDARAAKESQAVKRASSSTEKIKTDKAKEDTKLPTTASRALAAKDNLSNKRGYKTQSLSKLKSTVSKVSATELKATTSERSARKTSSLTKTNVHPSLRRSRWSGMLIEDSKHKEKRIEPAVSPNMGRALTSKEDQSHAKPRSSLQLRTSHGKLSGKALASKQSEKLAEEDHYAKMAATLKKRSRHSLNPRDPKTSRERIISAKMFPGRRISSPSRLSLRKGSYHVVESSNEGSDEDLAACVRETPSVAVASVKQPTLISKSPARKVTSYQLSPPPSSKKSLSAQKDSVKGLPFRSRSPVKRDSRYRYSDDRQLSDAGAVESVSRSGTDRERQSSTMLSSPSKVVGRYRVGAGVVKRSISQSSKVTEKIDSGAAHKKYLETRAVSRAERKLKRSRYTETSDLLPIEGQAIQTVIVEKKPIPVENRCTQVESWPDDLENDNVRQREGDHVSPKRTTHRTHHDDKYEAARRLQRHVASCRYRPKIVCCHRPPFKVHGRSKVKKPKQRPRYKYIVDPSLYDYIRKIHVKKGTWRRKCDSLPYESVHRFDTSETSYTSLRDLEISETSRSRTDASTSSSEYSNSCSSSIIQRKSNTVACLSLKDTATLCWNMSESNVQVQSSTHTSSVHKMSKDKRSRMKKGHHRHPNHETASDKGPKKASKMNKDGRRASRAPVTVPSQQNQLKPMKMDQPPEGPDARSAAQIRESAITKEAENDKNIATIQEECLSEQEAKELDALEAEISKAVEQLFMSQQEIDMKFEIVMESFNQLKENRRQILNDLAEKEREAKEATKPNPPKWEATYFDYFMFLTFLTVQIVFHIIFIKKL